MPVTNIKSRWRHGRLEFYDNVSGEVVDILSQVKVMDDFSGPAVDTVNDWNLTLVNFGTATAVDSFMTLTTGVADDDNMELASDLIFSGTNHAIAECKLRNDDADKQAFFFGFTDAITAGADLIPIDYSNAGALVSTAANAAGFVSDSDQTTNAELLMCVGVQANTDVTPVTTGLTPTDGLLMRLRVEIIDTTAYYWVNNVFITSITSAVTAATPLCVYIGSINREGAVNTLDVDYIRAWCNRTA